MIRFLLPLLALALPAAARPNVLLIAVDDLRPELASFGAAHIRSPAIDSLAASGRAFHRHYVQAPTCGASRYSLLTGRYARTMPRRNNNAIFDYAANHANEPLSLPEVFRKNGYTTVSLGKISHHPGGLGGENWNDPAKPELPGAWDRHEMPCPPWKTPVGAMHGYAGGKPRGPGTPASEHVAGDDKTYTDGWIAGAAERELENLAKAGKPFFLAVGLMKPHLPFACPERYREAYNDTALPPIPHPEKPAGLSTWHASGEFMRYNHGGRDVRKDAAYADDIRRSYAACVTYTDTQIGKILARLDALGLADDTVVVLWGDHGYHLGEHAVWGKHTLYDESLRAPLIIRTPDMAAAGTPSRAVVETVDIYPTLATLCGVPVPAALDGRPLALAQPAAAGRPAISYSPDAESIRDGRYALIRHRGKKPEFELYDHTAQPGETVNIAAENPGIVKKLAAELDRRMAPR